jgi:tetratricopeptide (TPR) repeat protein
MANKPNKRPQAQPQAQPQPKAATPKPAVKATPAPKPQSEKKGVSIGVLCAILAVVSFLLYANTLMNDFVMDDVMVLKDNRIVLKGFDGVMELFQTPHMYGYLTIPNDLYRPFSLVMFAIEYELFELSPTGYHLFNILWFAGAVVMFFLFLDKFFDRKKTLIAFIGALIFAVHPIHTEVVANIKSRDEIMSFFFAFLAMNLFINYMKKGSMLQLVLGSVAMFLSFISKETSFTLIPVIGLLFFFYINDDRKRAIFILGGTLLAAAIFWGIRTSVLNEYNANQPGAAVEFIDNALSALSGVEKFATEVVVMGLYLKLMFIPHPLLSTYSFNSIATSSLADWRFWLSLLAYGFIIYVAITRFIKNKRDPWAFAIIFYLASLSLFSNFPFLMGAELAERFAFFASVGFCLAAGLALEKWVIHGQADNMGFIKNGKVLAILAPLCLLFAGLTIARNTNWKSEYALYSADVANSPNDARLHHNLATAIAETVYPKETDTTKLRSWDEMSLMHLRRALEIYPTYADANVEMGRIYDRQKQYDSALKYNKRALELNPTNATAINNLGSIYLTSGRWAESIPYFKRAAEVNPNFKYAYLNLGKAYGALKIYDSAIMNYHKLLAVDPSYADAVMEIATNFFYMQRYDSSEYYYKQILAANPNEQNVIHNLGAIYLNTKQYAKAAEYFQKTVTLNPKHGNAYSNMGLAYYFSQQYPQAIDAFSKDLALDPRNGPRDIPYMALSYQKMGRMAEAREYEAKAKQYFSNFKLE